MAIETTIPIATEYGHLPYNLAFTPAQYQDILTQRLRLYLSGDNVLLGSMSTTEPAQNVGAWWKDHTFYAWDELSAKYLPIDLGLIQGSYGITLTAILTQNRKVIFPGADGTLALSSDVLIPADTIVVGNFADGHILTNLTHEQSATAQFDSTDVGKAIVGDNIQPLTTVSAVNSATDITLSQPATATGTGLNFTIIGREVAVIDYGRSTNFFLTLAANTTIKPFIGSYFGNDRGNKIRIAILNPGTAYTVTWPNSGATAVQWVTTPVQPVAVSAENALGIYTIREITINGVTPHLWGQAQISGFSSTPPDPTVFHNDDEPHPPQQLHGRIPYRLP